MVGSFMRPFQGELLPNRSYLSLFIHQVFPVSLLIFAHTTLNVNVYFFSLIATKTSPALKPILFRVELAIQNCLFMA